jgi:hypothetical protein
LSGLLANDPKALVGVLGQPTRRALPDRKNETSIKAPPR